MNTNFDKIDEALNIESSIVESKPIKPVPPKVEKDDVKKDYEYTRANLYSLIEKGQEAINGIMELAGQLIKSVADTTDKLADLQKKVKDLEEDKPKTQNNVTNNALFVGSTSDLSKMLKQGFLNNNTQDTTEN